MLMLLNKRISHVTHVPYCIWFLKCVRITNLCCQKEVFQKYWPFTLLRWWSVLHFWALYFWNSGLNSVTQMIVTYVTWLRSLRKSVADTKALLYMNVSIFYMNVSAIRTLMWMNQFNRTIISLVIASLFQIFSFKNLTCNKRYAAFT